MALHCPLLIRHKLLTLISIINVESTLTDLEKFHPPKKKSSPRLLISVSDIIAEPNDDFSHGHFEL